MVLDFKCNKDDATCCHCMYSPSTTRSIYMAKNVVTVITVEGEGGLCISVFTCKFSFGPHRDFTILRGRLEV
jgi:hypothetical protein